MPALRLYPLVESLSSATSFNAALRPDARPMTVLLDRSIRLRNTLYQVQGRFFPPPYTALDRPSRNPHLVPIEGGPRIKFYVATSIRADVPCLYSRRSLPWLAQLCYMEV